MRVFELETEYLNDHCESLNSLSEIDGLKLGVLGKDLLAKLFDFRSLAPFLFEKLVLGYGDLILLSI